jgi:hypothetical protein
MRQFWWGVLSAASAVASLLFLKFWRANRDPLLWWFSVAFALFAAHWTMLGVLSLDRETQSYAYLLRLAAFVLLLAGIAHKNRRRR